MSVHPPLDTRADERTFEAVWLFLLRSLSLLFVYMASSIGFLFIVLRCTRWNFILFLFLVPLQRQMEETQGGGKRNAVRIANRCRAAL